MTTEKTSAAQPSTEPAPVVTDAADTSQPTPATEQDEDALFREYAAKANARLDDSAQAQAAPIADPPPDDEAGTTESETAAKAAVSTSEPKKDEAAPAAATPAEG